MIKLNGLKKISRKRPVNTFFVELMIVVLFFSISGAVVLRMFASADSLSKANSTAAKCVMTIQSVSEIYAGNGDMKKTIDEYFGPGAYYTSSDDSCMVTLGEDMKPLYTEDARKRFGRASIWFSETTEQGAHGRYSELSSRLFLLFNGADEVYSQTSSAYLPDFAGGGVR